MRITIECLELARAPIPRWECGGVVLGRDAWECWDARENASPGWDFGSDPLAHHRESPRFVGYVEARTISRAISASCAAGCGGYPNSVRTAAIAASATATGLNSTVVRGGELISPMGLASTPITARSAGQASPASRMPYRTRHAISSLCAHTAVTPSPTQRLTTTAALSSVTSSTLMGERSLALAARATPSNQ